MESMNTVWQRQDKQVIRDLRAALLDLMNATYAEDSAWIVEAREKARAVIKATDGQQNA